MRQFKFGLAVLMAMILASCSGGNSDVPAKPKFTSHISFGDSLSDVGTYNVGFVAAAGGGQFSINGPNANGKAANGNNIVNWTEVIAMNLGLPAPCPAVTGLIDTTGGDALSVTVASHPGCTGYAQGGALVTNPAGIHNTAYGTYSENPVFGGAELTYPVMTQIDNYLAANGNSFSGKELVSVVVGGNEVQYQLIAQTGFFGLPPPTPLEAATAMAAAATQLVGYVNTKLLANGAKYVVVANIPDFAEIPALGGPSANPTSTQQLVDSMVQTFNGTLQAGLAGLPGSANVLYLDLYSKSKDQIWNPGKYGLIDGTTQACDPVNTPYNRALFCNASTLISGATVDSHYLFSDDTHPTPYGHALIAQYVLQEMTKKGWH